MYPVPEHGAMSNCTKNCVVNGTDYDAEWMGRVPFALNRRGV
jgi:hypothetical protein